MLVTIETIMQQLTEGGPSGSTNLGFDGLELVCCRAFQIMFRHADPQRLLHAIHSEILLTTTTPQAWIVTVEFGEGKLGKAT